MSESCSHDCSACGKSCDVRKEACAFAAKPNAASRIGKVIAVASGKGGVGKSLVTTALAVGAARRGLRVGILDADITGPSIPQAFGIVGGVQSGEDGFEPSVTTGGIRVMSLNMLMKDPSDPVVWRGPVIAGVVKQFWSDVHWGDLDILFVDMPPGTGDVPLTVYQSLPVEGIVVVSSPQELVEMIVAKSVRLAEMMKKPILGLVENMSYLSCPHCGERISVFGVSHAEELAAKFSIPLVVRLPMNPDFARLMDTGAAESLAIGELNALLDRISPPRRKLYVATHNAHKVREIAQILPEFDILPDNPEGVEETAPDFAGNALIKVRAIAARHPGAWCLADDSGLEVAALGGAPGVRSARYAGEPSDTQANNALLLKNLQGAADRRANFTCAIALVDPQGGEHIAEGRCFGHISEKPSGAAGFGYDPLFIPDGHTRSFADLSAEEKNEISHRGVALAKARQILSDFS